MESFDIRNVQIEDNESLHFFMAEQINEYFLLSNKKDCINKITFLYKLIRKISNKKLLKKTINILEKITKITIEKEELNSFYFENYVAKNYTELELIQIEAHFYSFYYLFKLRKAMFLNYCKEQNQEFPDFMFKIKNYTITHNSNDISKYCSHLNLNRSVDILNNSILSNIEKVGIIKTLINKYLRDTALNKDTRETNINYLSIAKENLVEEKPILLKPKHDDIFSNNGFILFEHILNEHVKQKDVKGHKSDLIFYYWKLYNNNPKYIHQKPTEFFNWFDREYSETSGQLKTYDNVKTTQREKDYSTALEWFKLQK